MKIQIMITFSIHYLHLVFAFRNEQLLMGHQFQLASSLPSFYKFFLLGFLVLCRSLHNDPMHNNSHILLLAPS